MVSFLFDLVSILCQMTVTNSRRKNQHSWKYVKYSPHHQMVKARQQCRSDSVVNWKTLLLPPRADMLCLTFWPPCADGNEKNRFCLSGLAEYYWQKCKRLFGTEWEGNAAGTNPQQIPPAKIVLFLFCFLKIKLGFHIRALGDVSHKDFSMIPSESCIVVFRPHQAGQTCGQSPQWRLHTKCF